MFRLGCGTLCNKYLQERFLRENFPLSKVIEYCKAVELAEKFPQELETDVLDKIRELKKKDNKKDIDADSNTTISRTDDARRANGHCSRCKKKHEYRNFLLYGKSCNNCGMLIHFAIFRLHFPFLMDLTFVQDVLSDRPEEVLSSTTLIFPSLPGFVSSTSTNG